VCAPRLLDEALRGSLLTGYADVAIIAAVVTAWASSVMSPDREG